MGTPPPPRPPPHLPPPPGPDSIQQLREPWRALFLQRRSSTRSLSLLCCVFFVFLFFKSTRMLDLSFPLVIVQHASVHAPIGGPHLKLTSEQRLFIALLDMNLFPPPKKIMIHLGGKTKKLVST